MSRSADFLRQLSPTQAMELESYALMPGRYGREVFAWLETQGVKTSQRAVFRWFSDLRDKAENEKWKRRFEGKQV